MGVSAKMSSKFSILMCFLVVISVALSSEQLDLEVEGKTDNCNGLAGTWTGTYGTKVSKCGHCDCPTTLFFEEVDGLEKTFFVNEPANIGCECLLECSDYEYGGETYIATCENSRVDMGKYFHGLVGTNSLLLQHTFEDES